MHLSLQEQDEIREELSAVGKTLDLDLTPGYEDMML